MADEKAKPETKEIASIDRDFNVRTFGGVLDNLDETLKSRGASKGLKIYDDLERDCHAFAVLQKRKKAVIAREWFVVPASKSAIDVAAAQMVKEQLGASVDDSGDVDQGGVMFDKITEDLLDATLKGFAVGEIMWGIEDNRIAALEVKSRDQRRFLFGVDGSLRLRTMENLLTGEVMPDRKFIVHRVGSKDGSPYGLGLGHKLFWPVFFKRQDITFWLTFADKFGSPTAHGKYPNGASLDEQKKLLQALQAIAQDAGIITPEGMVIDLLEAAGSGSTDTYEKLARYMDEQISECVLGETMTTSAQSTGLGSNQADVHNEVRVELAKADADLVCETLNSTLVRWLVDFNMPGAGYPKVWRNFEEEEDLQTRATRDKSIYDMGFEPTEEYIRNTYGDGWVKRQAPPQAEHPFGFGPQFSEAPSAQARANRGAQDAFVQAAEELSKQWQTLLGKRFEDLVSLLEETNDLATFRERLSDLLQMEPPKEVVETLARAQFAAHLIGRAIPNPKSKETAS